MTEGGTADRTTESDTMEGGGIEDAGTTSDSMVRREALRRLGFLGAGALAGVLSPPHGLSAASKSSARSARPGPQTDPVDETDRLDRIGLHLSSLDDLLERDFRGTLEAVAEIGFREVAFAGYHGRSAEEVRNALVAAGLEAPATRVSFRTMMSDWERSIVAAHIIGHRYLVVDGIPSNRRQSLNGYRRAAGLFNRAAATARVAGMGFAYRNRASDLEPMEDRIPYDLLLEETDPELVNLELDLHEIRGGGGNPLEYVEDHPGRYHLVHLRDTGADGQALPLGEGSTDFAAILTRRDDAGFRHYFVAGPDPEAPPDPEGPMPSIRSDYDYLSTLDF